MPSQTDSQVGTECGRYVSVFFHTNSTHTAFFLRDLNEMKHSNSGSDVGLVVSCLDVICAVSQCSVVSLSLSLLLSLSMSCPILIWCDVLWCGVVQ